MRWGDSTRAALTPRARPALDALLAFRAVGWELTDAEPGVAVLGLPDARVARARRVVIE